MFSSRFARMTLLGVVVLAGLWLLARGTQPAAEGVAHERAMMAYAPVTGVRLAGQSPGEPQAGAVQPVEVNLRDIPAGVFDPNNQLDRWRRGEIDLDESEGILTAAEMIELRAQSMDLAPSSNVHIASNSSAPGSAAPASGVSFESLDYLECCGGGGNVPPDPELTVGSNHVIAVVNVAFEIYDKNGNSVVGPTTFASFMSSNPSCAGVFDPNAIYDESADRYILGIDADGSAYCLAVSQTGDPTGSWNIYAFPTGAAFFDYPHAGVGRDAIYMGGNMFICTIGCSFLEGRVWAFDKQAMYNGQSASFVTRGLPNSEDTPQPLNLHGYDQGTWPSSGPHYFFTDTNFNGETYSIWSWNDPFGADTLTMVNTVDLEAYTGVTAGLPVNVPQSGARGSGPLLQANDFRPQDFEFRNGYGWSVQTIACNPGGGTVDCIRWAQIDLSSASVVDAGVYASSGEYRFFGDLAVNHCDDMAVGYTKSSTSTFPSVWVSGRLSSDAPGTLQAETLLKAGEISYTAFDGSPHRWGDYTGMTIDPNGDTFWYLGQYSKNTGTTSGRWGTYIGSFSYSCDDGGEPTPTPENTPTPGPTNTPGPTPTPTNTPEPTATQEPTPTATPGSSNTMHVGDLDGSGVSNGRTWTAEVTVLIVDSNGNPVSNALVRGGWANGANGNGSCSTNSSGLCSISRNGIRENISSVSFTVSNVTHDTLSYDAGANTDPDGDSNGTTITVSAP